MRPTTREARPTSTDPRGQILVIVAGAMLVIVAMVGLVIDGGSAWGQQRKSQNAADGVAMAGTSVIQNYLADASAPIDGGDVGCAVETAADAHGMTLDQAEYTNDVGELFSPTVLVPPCGSSAAIPAGSQGVKATASSEFATFLMRVAGFSTMTATAEATAVVGRPAGVCPAEDGCAVIPVTFPRTVDTCDGTSTRIIGESEWAILDEDATLDASNLAIAPLCKKAPGAVGWLDFGCGNLADHITNPCNDYINIPAWLQTSPGNPNCCENLLEAFTGSQPGVAEDEDLVLYIPIHDNTCGTKPADAVDVCPGGAWTGSGNNIYYHVPYWVGFKLDGAFTSGSDAECNQLPGNPFAGGNGSTGCLKGWFVSKITAPSGIVTGPITRGDPVALAIALIQ